MGAAANGTSAPVPATLPAEVVTMVAALPEEQVRALRAYLAANDTDPPRRCWGWKEIAAELHVAVRTAKEYDARKRDPLPTEHGHLGVWAYATALRDWVRRQNMSHQAHLEVVRARRDVLAAKAKAKTAPARAALAKRQWQRQGRKHARVE